jgi:hypothetical protein
VAPASPALAWTLITGSGWPLPSDERRGAEGFQFIFSPSEAVNDVYDDGILHVVELLSVVVYDVDQPAWAR